MRTSSSSSSGSEGGAGGGGAGIGDTGNDDDGNAGSHSVRIPSAFAVLALLVVPWTVVPYPSGYSLVFPWGSASTNPLHVTLLWEFLFRYTGGIESLPPRLFAWPLATLLYVVAALGAMAGLLGREDRRLTAGALVLAGFVHLRVTAGLSGIGETAIPVGALLAVVVAAWHYRGSSVGF
jgi:uncharacterized protein (TIGR04206 family)